MDYPKVGTEWNWTSSIYPVLKDVHVSVKKSLERFIVVNIEDQEVIERNKQNAEETYQRTQDMDAVRENHALVTKRENGKMVSEDKFIFTSLQRFYDECDQINA
mgnify:CR=1 FL=1